MLMMDAPAYIYQPLPPPWGYPKTLIHILLIKISCSRENRGRGEERDLRRSRIYQILLDFVPLWI
jgi:hypothetical protein